MTSPQGIEALCINTLRTLAIDVIERANSGHPGLPLGAAPMAYVLWDRHLKHCPTEPQWVDRDRFLLSAGHGSMLLYGLLHLTGYALPLEALLGFRQWASKAPGHPEYALTPGVEASTGPLGQGHGNAVGMAMAERALAGRFNKPRHTLINHFTYCMLGDGDVMEGVAQESASLAGHLKLGRLICLYDSNDVTLDGPARLCFSEDVGKRYEACGWHVQTVFNGDTDIAAIDNAICAAKADTQRPSLIIVKTTIGFGSPHKAGKSTSHGSPLGRREVALTKEVLGWPYDSPCFVPEEALAHFRKAVPRGEAALGAWRAHYQNYAQVYAEEAKEFQRCMAGELPGDFSEGMPTFVAGHAIETRTAAGQALNVLAARLPEVIGGAADLGASTKTVLEGEGNFDGQRGTGRNIAFGVREHAMAAIANGMSYHGGLRPFIGTFFCFVDYMRPAVRLAAMSRLPVIYVWTHDSIGVGEDGPTHQPVEQLMAMRSIPNLHVLRPADAAEAVEAWRYALQRKRGPTGLVLTRQKVPVLQRTAHGPASGLHKGAYILLEASGGPPQAIVLASGSEVVLARDAREILQAQGVPTRVVSMPCMEAFREGDAAYREAVLPKAVRPRVSIEAGVTLGWEAWVGEAGESIGINRFGASAPGEVLFMQYGLTADAVVQAVHRVRHRHNGA